MQFSKWVNMQIKSMNQLNQLLSNMHFCHPLRSNSCKSCILLSTVGYSLQWVAIKVLTTLVKISHKKMKTSLAMRSSG